ncbi:MAG: peptidylprolyl isomerase [Alphaproteobacteria bacterium]|nr:peptidylprolyl isomerase [Alphaproteobacteria bacterium]NDC56369.1 peptidylprolyl isomerase [Alphaproteobacteria bacterium]NDG05042.1 peptidylprolyl isomerase [Alphaproteobacteria bacterium]
MTKLFQRLFILALLAVGASVHAQQPEVKAMDPENTLIMTLPKGQVTIQLRPDVAPKHVERIKQLVRDKFYDGLVFHRVIPGFMAQTGDPQGNGTGGSGQKLNAEFSSTPFIRGTLGMARTSDPNSADSQFFICFDEAPHLNGQYTVWGQVTSGMEFVDALKAGTAANNGAVSDPDKIISVRIAADVKN